MRSIKKIVGHSADEAEEALNEDEQRDCENRLKRRFRKAIAKRESKPIGSQRVNPVPNVQVKKP